MNDIRALLKTAARRLELTSFIDILHMVGIVVASIVLGLIVADHLPKAEFMPWVWIGPALAVLTLGIAGLIWSRRRPSEKHVALVVDERLDLREKLSTALHVQGRDDAFAQAAIEDAVLAARDKRTQELVRRRFAIGAPRGWWISPLILLAALMTSMLPPLNLFERDQTAAQDVTQAKLDAKQSLEAVVQAIKKQPALEKEMEQLLGDLSKEGTDPNAPFRKPDDIKRDVLKKVTEAQKRLEDILSGEKGKTQDALEKAMNQLKTPEDGPAKELAEAMAKGDFAQAQQALKELMEKAQKGELNEADKEKLAAQMKDIAEQLEKLAQQQAQLEQALKQAGMDPQLAKNPQALQQALQNNQNLNQQQKQQLQQMAQAQQAAAQMCKGLGQACQSMAGACKAGGDKMGQAGQAMAAQLGDLENMQQMLMQAQAAANACKGQCQGLGQNLGLLTQSQGGAFGNRGQGRGGKAPIAKTPTGNKVEKANIKNTEGDIIAKTLFDGEIMKGESKAQLIKVVEDAAKGDDEALGEDQLHRKYFEAQKHYFGELEKLTKAIQEENKPAAPAPTGEAAEGEDDGQ